MMQAAQKPILFLGPTLAAAEAQALQDCDRRPPAAMGDITRAVACNPPAIILVDGYFDDRPSAWHKEILWALSRSIPVVGACSMGALRAAELYSLGMTGFGDVFNAYASGELTDDDEVAVVHGPAELGYLPLSDAMVDIRHRVRNAVQQNVLDAMEASAILQHAKSLHFKQRSLISSTMEALRSHKTEARLAHILQWFSRHTEGIKALDCKNLLQQLNQVVCAAREAMPTTLEFSPTIYLRRLEPFGFPYLDHHQT